MECDEDESMSMWSADVTRNNESSDGSVKPKKRLKLSLSRTKNKTATAPLKDCSNDLSRFIAPVSSPEREKAAKGVIPANTRASSNWAIRNFNDWASNRSAMTPDDPVPADLLKSQDTVLLCKWLC